MKHYNVFLPSYSIGEDCYKEIPWITRHYGSKVIVIGGKTAMSKAKDSIIEALKESKIEIIDFIWYGGEATYENVEMLINDNKVKKADFVFAIGGGRAIDTCKVLCQKIDKPLFTFPTIASNCAACTSIAVMYNEDGTFKDYFYPNTPANHTFINTRIIAEAPENLFWAGIGDALSKETEVLFATRNKELFHTTLLGAQLSKTCDGPLLEFGLKALEDCKINKISYELEQVVLDIIISTGLVSNLTCDEHDYYYNSSIAHAVYYGSTIVPSHVNHLHGEVVAFGVLCLLTYDKQYEKREKLIEFNKSIGLPTTLKDIEIKLEDVKNMADKAEGITEWYCAPYEITKEKFIEAILKTNEYCENKK